MNDTELQANFDQLSRELSEIRALLQTRRRPSENDEDFLRRLLPVIGARRGSDNFTTGEIFRDAALKDLIGVRTPAQIGSMFARAAATGQDFSGHRIEAIGKETNKTVWNVLRRVP
jgi:hypothetical protein